MTEGRFSVTEVLDRYRQTLVFNNDFLKREYPERYKFNTAMEIDKKRRYGVSEAGIDKYRNRRDKEYDKKYQAYCNRLDSLVEPSVNRYIQNMKAAFSI